MNIVFCQPGVAQVQLLHAQLSRAFSAWFSELLLFGFSGAAELCEYLTVSPDSPDIAILSLDMRDGDVWSLADWVGQCCPAAQIVLTGTPLQQAELLYARGIAYYLGTPVQENSVARFAARIHDQQRQHHQRLLPLTTRRGTVHIAFDDITFVSSDRRKICVQQANGQQDEAYKKLDEIQALLDDRFVRCHQSFLVNMDWIRGITGESFLLADSRSIPISQKRYWEAKRQYVQYIKRKG